MATHSSILAWEVPRTEEPAKLQSMELHRAGQHLAAEHSHMRVCAHTYTHSYTI